MEVVILSFADEDGDARLYILSKLEYIDPFMSFIEGRFGYVYVRREVICSESEIKGSFDDDEVMEILEDRGLI